VKIYSAITEALIAVVLRNWVFLRCDAGTFRRINLLHVQALDCFTLKMKAIKSFVTL